MSHRYYLAQRHPGLGTHPAGNTDSHSYAEPRMIQGTGRTALGWVEYGFELDPAELERYGMFDAGASFATYEEAVSAALQAITHRTGRLDSIFDLVARNFGVQRPQFMRDVKAARRAA